MSDLLAHPGHGPDSYWSDQLPPTRGQYQTIAVLALELLQVDRPEHRLDASIAITRLRNALQLQDPTEIRGGGHSGAPTVLAAF